MADINLDALLSSLDRVTASFNSIGQEQSRYAELLSRSTREDLEKIRGMTKDSETILRQAIDNELQTRNKLVSELTALYNKQTELEREYQSTVQALNDAETEYQRQYYEEKRQQLEQEKQLNEDTIAQKQLAYNGEQEELRRRQEVAERKKVLDEEELENQKKHTEELEKARQERIKVISKISDVLTDFADRSLKQITGRFENAVDSITSAYQEHAGKLSAQLNATVSDISSLQNNIAETLRDTSLSKAISNVQVLNEAASLASAGYTDETTLQQNATDIAIGRQLAPNLDFNNATVKNLINVFGSDFTTKFSAISAAVQETAGSTAGLAESMSTLMTDLEPVYTNAELQAAALQGGADVSATISSALEQGIITESQADEYRSMLVELMDPSKALSSSNVAVRVAATQYQWDGNPANALNALLSATRSMYGNVDQSNTYEGYLTRSLYASAMGLNNTMDATYNQQGLTGVQMLSTGNLDATYQEQLNKLESGDYTTRETELQNQFVNSQFAQTISEFSKSFPILYRTTSAMIIDAINGLPSKLNGLFKTRLNNSSSGIDIDTSFDGGDITGAGGNGKKGLSSTLSGILFSPNSARGIGKAGSTLSKVTGANLSGMAGAGVVIGGISSLINTADYAINNEGSALERMTYGGDQLQSTLNYASIGATAGFALGSILPGVGNALGTAVGAVVGGIGGFIAATAAQTEATEKQIAAQEALTKATEDTLGYQVEALSAAEAKAAIARGGGTIALNSGTYEIDSDYYDSLPKYASGLDYVPYDNYLVRLHKGEAVVTANAAQTLRRSDPNFWNTPIVHNDDVVYELKDQTEKIVKAVKGEDKYESMQYQGPQTYVIQNTN